MSDPRCQMSVASEAKVSSLTSDISSWRNYANTVTRPAFCYTDSGESSWLHGGGGDFAGVGDRRQYHDLQPHQRRAFQAASASERARSVGVVQSARVLS